MKQIAIPPSADESRLPTVGYPYPFYRCPASFRQNTLQALFPPIADDKTIAGNHAYKIVKLLFDRRKIREDVGMIKLQIIEYCRSSAESGQIWSAYRKKPCHIHPPR